MCFMAVPLQLIPTTWDRSRSACGRPTPGSRCSSWRKSSTSAATWRAAAASRWRTRCVCRSARSKCGSRTDVCAGKRTTSFPTPGAGAKTRGRRTSATATAASRRPPSPCEKMCDVGLHLHPRTLTSPTTSWNYSVPPRNTPAAAVLSYTSMIAGLFVCLFVFFLIFLIGVFGIEGSKLSLIS